MKAKRHTYRSLKAESLERRELLAADWGGGTAIPPESCQTDDVAIVQGPMQASATESASQPQQRSREEASSGTGALQQPRDRISEEVDVETDVTLATSTSVSATQQGGAGQSTPVNSELNAEEIENLLFVREEEKLARDVYLALAEKWDVAIFANIAQSEQQHMDAVGQLIEKYGLTDPIADDTPGVFANATLQDLYSDLVSDGEADLRYLESGLLLEGGSTSQLAALKVGAFIEEFDILDIQHAIAQTDNSDIETVYGNLLKGSRNHLRSFVGQIEAAGGDYEPAVMTGTDPVTGEDLDVLYLEIILDEQETATGRGSGRQQSQSGPQTALTTSQLSVVAIDLSFAQYGGRSGGNRL